MGLDWDRTGLRQDWVRSGTENWTEVRQDWDWTEIGLGLGLAWERSATELDWDRTGLRQDWEMSGTGLD